jgi:arginase
LRQLEAFSSSTCYPEPNGVLPRRLVDLISQVDDIIGAAITQHAPSDDVNGGEAEVIRSIGTALARADGRPRGFRSW